MGSLQLPMDCPADMEDSELIARFVSGDDDAFATIVNRHRPRIFALAHGFLHNETDAEEVAQDTFIRAYRGLAQFRGESSLSTWLHRIAVNLARNRYWYFFRRYRHATLSLDCPIGEQSTTTYADVVASNEADPARETARGEMERLVTSCMEELPEHQRRILTLRNLQERSYEEIAAELGINRGTVKSRIARARERLKAHLEEASV
jgi:RNA polymerase sigma-70 factor (ECF subfamily)